MLKKSKTLCSLAVVLMLLLGNVAALRLRADDQPEAAQPDSSGPSRPAHESHAARALTPAQQVHKLAPKYRSLRATPKQRAAVLKELVAVGPEGIAAAKELVGKELQIAEGQVNRVPNTKSLDDRIAELRKTLADLRNDPNLSHAQTENIGLPALSQLLPLYGQRVAQMANYKNKTAKATVQLRQVAETVGVLCADWRQNPPLPLDDYQAKIEKLLAIASPPEEEAIAKVLAENARLAQQLPGDIAVGMQSVNNIRMACGLKPLLYDLKLCEAARGHSADMQQFNFFAHESPVPGRTTFSDRAKQAGTTASGENIYMGSFKSADAVKGWFLSPGHHKNMLSENHLRQGLGQVGKYWTQEFGR